jgi:hypothetical protein
MQIHEVTRKQLNELDLAGSGGLWSNIKTAGKAMMQPGGVKDALRTVAPGAGQGATNTADQTQSDFAQRMQGVKNDSAMKQVAANMQAQWEKARAQVSQPSTTPAPAVNQPSQPAAGATAMGQMAGQLAKGAAAQPSTMANAPVSKTNTAKPVAPVPAGTAMPTKPYQVPGAVTTPNPAKPAAAPAPAPAAQSLDLDQLKKDREAKLAAGQVDQHQAQQQIAHTQATNAQTSQADNALIAAVKAAKAKPGFQQTLTDKNAIKQGAAKGIYESLGLKKYTKSRLLVEAANLNQLTDWYEKTVIPKTYAKFAQEYLQEPTIRTSLQNIANAETLSDARRKTEQGKEFINLVAATAVMSQKITADNPQAATAASSGRTSAGGGSSSSVAAAKATLQKPPVSMPPATLDAVEKITGTLPPVKSDDQQTIDYLKALGFDTK